MHQKYVFLFHNSVIAYSYLLLLF